MGTLTPSLTRYRVAAIQYEPMLGEKEKNVINLLGLVEEAGKEDARLIVLPEMAVVGCCWSSREEIAPYVEPIPGSITERFQELSTRYGCFIVLGLPEVDSATQAYYNSVALLGPEGLVGTYRKLHSYVGEPRWARDGDLGIPIWDTPLGRLSILIGADVMYFESARIAALHGADVLLCPMNWCEEKSPSGWWIARAFENGIFVVTANRHGCERGVRFSGESCILNPDGSLQNYLSDGNGIVYGEVDLGRSRDRQWRQGDAVVGYPLADRRPAEYTPLVNNTYLWEPLRYHGLYGLSELPPGQLSCVGFVQMDMQIFGGLLYTETISKLQDILLAAMRDNAPACPDVLVLPELLLPGPAPIDCTQEGDPEKIAAHFRQGAIQVPGPETDALIAVAKEVQASIVVGVAERAGDIYYNTVLLVDSKGICGTYRKLHLCQRDRLWAKPGNLGLPTFDISSGRIGLATGYDVLFPETLRVLAGKGVDLVCAPTLLSFPIPIGLTPTSIPHRGSLTSKDYDPLHYLIWRVRAAEHNVYLALANWFGEFGAMRANGLSGIFSPTYTTYPCQEVIADEDESGLMMMMTIDTREQRTGRRTSRVLEYSPGDMAGSLTGELAYSPLDSIPGNVVRSKPMLRRRQPFWYLDLVRAVF